MFLVFWMSECPKHLRETVVFSHLACVNCIYGAKLSLFSSAFVVLQPNKVSGDSDPEL